MNYKEFLKRDHFSKEELIAFSYGRLVKDPPIRLRPLESTSMGIPGLLAAVMIWEQMNIHRSELFSTTYRNSENEKAQHIRHMCAFFIFAVT